MLSHMYVYSEISLGIFGVSAGDSKHMGLVSLFLTGLCCKCAFSEGVLHGVWSVAPF